ncbi:tRNA (adenine(58)-N(1))-methyltransferase catalytic subunit TRMT61A [Toxocara canis]|uniref:Vacuolar protein-sorting-associated protein 25 n=1 Tax=Toxocara canis TaxID=6265 RepID=A0A0B2V682_TOXCA|nr:tRNA (adenine(58)-N(1))-methyltransferase catalytic subunit TRMT61A [Toxocara canis]
MRSCYAKSRRVGIRIQTTLVTREKQLEAWSRLVVDYCQFHKIYTLDITDISNTELFVNATLNRRLPLDGVRAVFGYLEHKRHIDWLDKSKNRCHIYWRRPEEWASLIYEWAVSNGLLNTPCTLYEITQGDDVAQESFYGLDKDVLLKSLAILVNQRRAQLLNIGKGNNYLQRASDFLTYGDVIEEGDTVIVYVNFGTAYAVEVRRGCTLNMRYGALKHEFLIGKRYGSRVSATAGYVYALRPSAALWTRTLPRRTQILYTPDCALILLLLDAKPGSVLCESGTGSGSLSHALAMAISPTGHLYTHDIEEPRVKQVEEELKKHGLGEVTTCVHQNVCEDGFFVENACDGVFLDLPAPWTAISHAKRALSRTRGGRIVSFSPCVEQVQRVCDMLRRQGFVQIETVELVSRKLKVADMSLETLKEFAHSNVAPDESGDGGEEERGGKRRRLDLNACVQETSGGETAKISHSTLLTYPAAQPTHTGYLTCATLLSWPMPATA